MKRSLGWLGGLGNLFLWLIEYFKENQETKSSNNETTGLHASSSLLRQNDIPIFDFYKLLVEQSKQVHNDVWNGVRFFLTLNTIVMASIGVGVIAKFDTLLTDPLALIRLCWTTLPLSIIGALITGVVAIPILYMQRRHYLECQIKKSIIERALHLTSEIEIEKLHIDLSLPWTIANEQWEELINKGKVDWINNIRFAKGTISRRLILVYIGALYLYTAMAAFCSGFLLGTYL
jgi:hypothetical protein